MSRAEPTGAVMRWHHYTEQNGHVGPITPRQRRRLTKKARRHATGSPEISAKELDRIFKAER